MTPPPVALAHELSCRYLQPLLDLAESELEPGELESLLKEWQVERSVLRDQTNWVSLRFCEALVELLASRLGSEDLTRRVTRAALKPRALGFLYPLIRAIGTPRSLYSGLPQIVANLNKVSAVKVLVTRRGYAEIEYQPTGPLHQERSPLICRVRRAQLIACPTLWDLAEARLEEPECQALGGTRCLYRLWWAERAGWWGTLAGAVLGLGLGWALGAGPFMFATLLAGTLAGRQWDHRRQVAELKRFGEEQTAALQEAAQASERRFVELEKAKAEVDAKVEQRTAELRQATSRLQSSLEQLEELARVKDEFLANVSHELRTPLTLILAPLEELLSGHTSPSRASEHLIVMHRNAVRLNSLVGDLLDLARLQAGQLRLRVEEIDLHPLLVQVVEQFRPVCERKGLALHLETSVRDAKITVDPGRMEFVLVNLLSNAVKFTPSGGTVSVALETSEDSLSVTVRDTGPGIPEPLQTQVFERFSHFQNTAAPGAAGTGIGLALVKELVELHRGQVSLRSEPGQGTAITVKLRRGRDHLRDEVLAENPVDVSVPSRRSRDVMILQPAPSEPARPQGWAPPFEPYAGAPRVLVVEDHEDMRAFLSSVLRRRYHVLEAPDGQTAWEAALRERPDAVLSDVMMPGLSGYELCRRLKSQAATRIIPVLLITAKKDTDRALEGFGSGADDYLIKPFNGEELLARIDVHLRLRRLIEDRIQGEKLAVMGTLAAGLAHEVRNPATAILAGLPRLRRELSRPEIPEAARQMLDVAIESAERISRLVGDLLELGQPDRDGPRLWNLHEGIEATLRLLKHRIPDQVRVECHFAYGGEVLVRPPAINQVFLNLLDNALRAVEQNNGKGGRIEIETRAEEGGVAVVLSDTGPGVPREIAARIFDPFFTTREVGQGTGLGLHISRRVAADHGGKLELVGTGHGHGACFKLWLPTPSASSTC